MPTRPATLDDVPAVVALFDRSDTREFGSPQLEADDLTGPLAAEGTRALLVEDAGQVVAYGHVTGSGEAESAADDVAVQEPLLQALVEHARARGVPRLEHWTGPHDDSPVAALLRRTGFVHARTAWELGRDAVPLEPTVPAPLPDGVRWRTFDRGRDAREVHALVQRAFDGTFGSHRRTFEEWSGLVLDAGADVLCLEQDGALVAVATRFLRLGNGHVGQLAVDAPHRGRGLALALLEEVFRRDAAEGRPRTTLAVDGENVGARRLYERAGMRVLQEWRRWELTL